MKREFTWHKVEADEWFTTIREKLNAGFTYFDFLTGVDREIADSQLRTEVITHLAKPDLSDSIFVHTCVSEALDSISDLFQAASWHERECAEMYGIAFTGGDSRSLLRHETLSRSPLRKSTVLAARVLIPWPGGAEPEIRDDGRKVGNSSRRRQRPPGVPENWLKL
ncbi:MAG: NADH-quinone oxidoreductase subunit C [Candidatus Nanopelagicales bacterium]|jgi:NADH-quinone oxidoreductase subunit C